MAGRPANRRRSLAARDERIVQARIGGQAVSAIAKAERVSEATVKDVLDRWAADRFSDPDWREKEREKTLAWIDEMLAAWEPLIAGGRRDLLRYWRRFSKMRAQLGGDRPAAN